MQDQIHEAKSRLSLSDLMGKLGHSAHAKKSARCPFHEDASASFSIYRGDDGFERWKCHAMCGSGDAIDYLAKARNLTPADAIAEFKRWAGVDTNVPAYTSAPPAPTLPRSAAPSKPPAPSALEFDWPACVAAFTPGHQGKLCTWRKYSPEFVAWLHANAWVGLYEGHIAFPVHNQEGETVGCHYRVRGDGSWRFAPIGTRTAPLVIGKPGTAGTVLIFESQWDALAVADRLGWHLDNNGLDDASIIITRGAGNGRLVAGLCGADSTAYLFPQNDPTKPDGTSPALKWLAATAAACGSKHVLRVATPTEFNGKPMKDANDWTRAGATAEEIQATIAAAKAVSIAPAAPHPNPAPGPENPDGSPADRPAVEEQPQEHQTEDDSESEDDAPATPFPMEALPPVMRYMVSAVASVERVPDSLPACVALAVVSTAIGKGIRLESGGTQITPGNLYLILSAKSGVGKSKVFAELMSPLRTREKAMSDKWNEETGPKVTTRIAELEKLIDEKLRRVTKMGNKPDDDPARLRAEIQHHHAELDLLKRKRKPRLTVEDTTMEALAMRLSENNETLASISSDASACVQNLLGKYSKNNEVDDAPYLKAFSLEPHRVDRTGRDSIHLEAPCLGICWAIQPYLLEKLMSESALSDGGFLARALVCHTRAQRQPIQFDPPSIEAQDMDQWQTLIGSLIDTYHGAPEFRRIVMGSGVWTAFREYDLEILAREKGELSDIESFTARWREQAQRISVVIHAATHGKTAHEIPMSADTARSAIQIARWFASQQLEILARFRRKSIQETQTEVLKLLDEFDTLKGRKFITPRDTHRARIKPTADECKAVLAAMEKSGLLVGQDCQPAGGGKIVRRYTRPQGASGARGKYLRHGDGNPIPG